MMFRLISRAVSLEATPLFDRVCLLVTRVPETSVVSGPSAMTNVPLSRARPMRHPLGQVKCATARSDVVRPFDGITLHERPSSEKDTGRTSLDAYQAVVHLHTRMSAHLRGVMSYKDCTKCYSER